MKTVDSRAKSDLPPGSAIERWHVGAISSAPEGRALVVLTLAVIAILGLSVRSLALVERQVWFDEAFSWRVAQLPETTFRSALIIDQNPPLFLTVLRYWLSAWGDTTLAVRSLSLLSGLLMIPASYLLVKDACVILSPQGCSRVMSGEAHRVGLFAAALVALNPFQILYSVEARSYAMGASLALVSSWLLLRALPDGQRRQWPWWLLYAVAAILFAYTHYFALLTIACQGLFVVWRLAEREGGRWWLLPTRCSFLMVCAAFAVVGIGYLPWLPIMYLQVTELSGIRGWLPPLTSGWQVLEIIAKAIGEPQAYLSSSGTARIALIFLSFLAISIYRAREVDWFFICLGVGPLVMMTVAALTGMRILHPRYLAFAQPFLLAMIALTALRGRSMARVLLAFFLLTASAWASADIWVWPEWTSKPGFKGVASYIAEHRRAGEPVLVANGFIFLPLLFYAPDREDYYVVPPEAGHYVAGQIVIKAEEIPKGDYFTAWSGRRIWVVNTNGLGGPPTEVIVPDVWQAKERNAFQESSGAIIEVVRYDACAR